MTSCSARGGACGRTARGDSAAARRRTKGTPGCAGRTACWCGSCGIRWASRAPGGGDLAAPGIRMIAHRAQAGNAPPIYPGSRDGVRQAGVLLHPAVEQVRLDQQQLPAWHDLHERLHEAFEMSDAHAQRRRCLSPSEQPPRYSLDRAGCLWQATRRRPASRSAPACTRRSRDIHSGSEASPPASSRPFGS